MAPPAQPPFPPARRPVALAPAALTGAFLPGLLPSGAGPADPLALAAWLALIAPAVGALAGAAALRSGPRGAAGLAAPLAWWAVLALLARGGPRLPDPAGAGLAIGGLFLLGAGLGAMRAERAAPRAAGLALLALLLALLPTGGGLLAEPWPPAWAARLLDLSPLSFVLERGGLDWMRHPWVYEPAGAASIGPDLRVAGRGALAPGLCAVVGCALLVASWAMRRKTSPA